MRFLNLLEQSRLYAGKVVEANVARLKPESRVTILRDGVELSSSTTVKEVTKETT